MALIFTITVVLLLACSNDEPEMDHGGSPAPGPSIDATVMMADPSLPANRPFVVGNPLAVPTALSPLQSGDIIFRAHDFSSSPETGSGLFRVRPDGSGLTRLTTVPSVGHISMSPDGGNFAWSSEAPGTTNNGLPNWDVFVGRDPDGKDRVNLTNSPEVRDFPAPVWSPDGSLVAYIVEVSGRSVTLVVMAPDGSNKRTIATLRTALGLAWLPDGSSISGVADVGGQTDVIAYKLDGSRAVNVTQSPENDYWNYGWSNRGGRVAWVVQELGGHYRLFVDSLGATDPREVALPDGNSVGNGPVVWSPSDDRIAVVVSAPSRTLAAIRPDGEAITHLASDIHSQPEYRWSPDGSQLIYLSSGGPCREGCPNGYLNIVNSDGSGSRRLSDLRVTSILGWLR